MVLATLAGNLLPPPLQFQSWLADAQAHGWATTLLSGLPSLEDSPRPPLGSSFVQAPPKAESAEPAMSLETGCILAVIVILVCIIFELVHLWYFSGEWTEEEVAARTANRSAQTWQFKTNLRIAFSYFNGEGAVRGRILVIVVIVLGAIGVGMSYISNVLVGRYWDALSSQNYENFLKAVFAFCCIAMCGTILGAYTPYIQQMLHIHYRESLTRQYWTKWLNGSAHYRARHGGVHVENADQRIQQDCDQYTHQTTGLFFGFINHLLTLAVFLPLLWTLSPEGPVRGVKWPGWLCQFALVYAIFGTWLVDRVGRRLIDYEYGQERSDADYRSRFMTIRDEGETVAMLGAEEAEMDHLSRLFGYMRSLYWQISFLKKRLGITMGFFGVLGEIIPLLVLAPAYFDGTISLGAMLQCRNALGKVQGCFQWGMHSYNSFAEWQCTSSRLAEIDSLAEAAKGLDPLPQKGDFPGKIAAKGLTIGKPLSDEKLLDKADFDTTGKWTVITGPEGAGKTTLLRALKGLWPAEEGEVQCSDALFMPVSGKCGALRRGTLHQAVAYPQAEEDFTREQVVAALKAVDLDQFQPEDYASCWHARLSSGQFQRLQLAHIICAQPELLVLDEPTSHTAPGQAKALFETLKQKCPQLKSVLTVTHQKDELCGLHDDLLVLDTEKKKLEFQGRGRQVTA